MEVEMSYTFAVGDLHGCLKELNQLLTDIKFYTKSRTIDSYTLLFIGDYIDRGPDSKGCIDRIMNLQEERPDKVIALMGNHEDMMIDAMLSYNGSTIAWLSNGGQQTLKSFRVQYAFDIDDKYKNWLRSLPLYHDDGLRFFVHAGVAPGIQPKNSIKEIMLWIRNEFLYSDYKWDRLIVHGHTPTKWAPENYPNRVNIDTGCIFGGNLTAAIFNDIKKEPIDFLSVIGPSSRSMDEV